MENTTASVIPDEFVVNKIYEVRGFKVMFDSDLANLYGVETKRLNEQVRRNPERFPPDLMFRLDDLEWQSLRSQIATSNIGRGGRKYLPLVFTEHGILMLSSVLNSRQAIQISLQIVRIFTVLRKMMVDFGNIKDNIKKIESQLTQHDKNLELIFTYLDQLGEVKRTPRKRIGFKPDDL